MRKGFALPLILAIVVIVILGVGVIVYSQLESPAKITFSEVPLRQFIEVDFFEDCAKAGNPILETYPRQCKTPDGKFFTEIIQSTPSPSPQSSTDEIAIWKAYTNKTLGFSVKYPHEWSVSEETAIEKPNLYANQFKGVGVSIGEGGKNYSCNLIVNWGKYYSADFSNEYSFGEWISSRKVYLSKSSEVKDLKEEDIMIDKNSAVNFSYTNETFLGEISHWETYIPLKNIVMFITGNNPAHNEDKCDPTYDQILSTFQFLD